MASGPLHRRAFPGAFLPAFRVACARCPGGRAADAPHCPNVQNVRETHHGLFGLVMSPDTFFTTITNSIRINTKAP